MRKQWVCPYCINPSTRPVLVLVNPLVPAKAVTHVPIVEKVEERPKRVEKVEEKPKRMEKVEEKPKRASSSSRHTPSAKAMQAIDEAEFQIDNIDDYEEDDYESDDYATTRKSSAKRVRVVQRPDVHHDTAGRRIHFLKGTRIDPDELHRAVIEKGGFEAVVNSKLWQQVRKRMNLPHTTSSSTQLRDVYLAYFQT
jgi:hypothetical protein